MELAVIVGIPSPKKKCLLQFSKMAASIVNLRCIWSSRTVELDLFGNSRLLTSMGMASAELVCSKEPLRTAGQKPSAASRASLIVFII